MLTGKREEISPEKLLDSPPDGEITAVTGSEEVSLQERRKTTEKGRKRVSYVPEKKPNSVGCRQEEDIRQQEGKGSPERDGNHAQFAAGSGRSCTAVASPESRCSSEEESWLEELGREKEGAAALLGFSLRGLVNGKNDEREVLNDPIHSAFQE